MTEELKTCDFYNEKICTLFSKYFGFNVECKNVFLSTIDCDIERECPIKRLEQENKELKKENLEYDEELAIEKLSHKSDLETLERYRSALEKIKEIAIRGTDGNDCTFCNNIFEKINEILN